MGFPQNVKTLICLRLVLMPMTKIAKQLFSKVVARSLVIFVHKTLHTLHIVVYERIANCQKVRRKLEPCWHRTGLAVHKAMHKDQCRVVDALRLLGSKSRCCVEFSDVEAFSHFFSTKIANLRADLMSFINCTSHIERAMTSDIPFLGHRLDEFPPVSMDEVEATIL
ncbi:unnamed protein product [Clavelina lepadiformis]|uniref:Uncharacterized protein n=1 Tax=Clavelina lepadiformis TaxID=159417 RepID=A0ABP0FSL5_CLALP